MIIAFKNWFFHFDIILFQTQIKAKIVFTLRKTFMFNIKQKRAFKSFLLRIQFAHTYAINQLDLLCHSTLNKERQTWATARCGWSHPILNKIKLERVFYIFYQKYL